MVITNNLFSTSYIRLLRCISCAAVVAFSDAHFGEGVSNISLGGLYCTGNESRLLDCSHQKNPVCSHTEDAGVRCGGEI